MIAQLSQLLLYWSVQILSSQQTVDFAQSIVTVHNRVDWHPPVGITPI